MSPVLTIILVVFGLLAAGSLAAVEAALAQTTQTQAKRWSEQGRQFGHVAVTALAHSERTIAVAVFLRILCEATAVGAAVYWAAERFDGAIWAVLTAAFTSACAAFIVVGASPRTFGARYSETVLRMFLSQLMFAVKLSGWFVRLLAAVANWITPGKGPAYGPFASEVELRQVVDKLSESDNLALSERKMVQSVLDLDDTLIREVMVPRTDLVTLDSGASLHSALSLFNRSGFSRVPIIAGSRDNILGILYLKDVVARVVNSRDADNRSDLSALGVVDELMRPADFVPDSVTVERQLEHMKANQSHVSILVDEYGGTAGLVTIEDLIEEIVGEISDEHDTVQDEIEDLGDGRFRVSARANVSDVAELFGLDVDDEHVDTVGGLLAKALGRVPIPGATAEAHGMRLTSERHLGRRKQLAWLIVERAAHPAEHD